MKILRIDGVDFELTEQAAQAMEKLRARLDTAEGINKDLKVVLKPEICAITPIGRFDCH